LSAIVSSFRERREVSRRQVVVERPTRRPVDSPATIGKLRVVHALGSLRSFAVVVVFVPLALGAVGCRRDRCVPVCEQRAKELDCHPTDSCKLTCDKLHTATTCAKELKTFEDCFLGRPVKEWICDSDGTPVVRPESCGAERDAVMRCMQITK
jgi:hypothetical protein